MIVEFYGFHYFRLVLLGEFCGFVNLKNGTEFFVLIFRVELEKTGRSSLLYCRHLR